MPLTEDVCKTLWEFLNTSSFFASAALLCKIFSPSIATSLSKSATECVGRAVMASLRLLIDCKISSLEL